MDEYDLLKKVLGRRDCPECGKTLKVNNGIAYCNRCTFEAELKYHDSKRNRDNKDCVQYRKLEDLLPPDTE